MGARPSLPGAGTLADRSSFSAILAMILWTGSHVVFRPFGSLVGRSFDDAFYFARIAENAASGLGFTFDGLHPTNGFQPLWQLLLVPLYWLHPGGPETLFRLQLGFQVVLLAVAAWLFRALMRTFVPGVAGLIGVLLFVFLGFRASVNGMETSVQVLMLTVLATHAWRRRPFQETRPGPALEFGLLAGLTLLARLDLVLLVIAISGVALVQALDRRGNLGDVVRRYLAMGAGTALLIVPYLIYNRVAFGAAVPVSGLLKSSFPVPIIQDSLPERLGVRGLVHLSLAVAFAVTWLVGRARGRPLDPPRRFWHALLMVASCSLLLHITYSMLFMGWGVFRWHFAWYGLVTCLVLSEAVHVALARIEEISPRVAAWGVRLAAVLAVLIVVGGALEAVRAEHGRRPYNWHLAAYEAGLWARQHLPDDAVMAMHDAGLFGYFSRRRVVNLDGVVNDLEYQRQLREGRLAEYLRAAGVRYLVKHDFGDVDFGEDVDIRHYRRTPYRVLSRLYYVWSDTLWLERAHEVYRSREFQDQGKTVTFAIWDLAPSFAGAAASHAPPGSDLPRAAQP
jgi:hypothetical protein